jgi:predicted histidine transporter YuiF (NhaC family)
MLTAEVAMLNGLIGETDSLLKAVLSTIDENFDQKRCSFVGDILLQMLGLLVVVPSNPETNFFQLVEGILNLLKNHEWGANHHYLRVRILTAIIGYLAAQSQDTLPYHITNVDSNDRIFIGNEDFKREANQLLDHCFD